MGWVVKHNPTPPVGITTSLFVTDKDLEVEVALTSSMTYLEVSDMVYMLTFYIMNNKDHNCYLVAL